MAEKELQEREGADARTRTAGGADAMGAEGLRGLMRGYAVLARACAAVLVNEPNDAAVAHVVGVAHALGDDRFDGIAVDNALRQRYFDRFFVSSTPYFVPLTESAVVKRWTSEGRLHYGALDSARCDHVQRCYKTVGFDWRALKGYAPAIQNLHPDSMASELAFMAGLADAAAEAPEDHAQTPMRLLGEFARLHARWFSDGASCLAATADDLYARVAAFAAEGTSLLVEALDSPESVNRID